MRDELRAIQMQQPQVKFARHRQWLKRTRRFILTQVFEPIMTLWMKDKVTSGKFFQGWPIITFVLIAARAGINEVG